MVNSVLFGGKPYKWLRYIGDRIGAVVAHPLVLSGREPKTIVGTHISTCLFGAHDSPLRGWVIRF
jgi:hypothetical protein